MKLIQKKGHFFVPLFLFFMLLPVHIEADPLHAYFLPVSVSIISSFGGDGILNEKSLASAPYIKRFSVLGRADISLLFLTGHALYSIMNNHPLGFERKALVSLAYAGILAVSLKYIFHRSRPNTMKNVFYGISLSGKNVSFPSGHTQIAFVVATDLAYRYGHPAIFYSLSTLVGIARIAEDMHYLSDVVMGAFTGYFVGRITFGKVPEPRIYIYTGYREVRFMYLLK